MKKLITTIILTLSPLLSQAEEAPKIIPRQKGIYEGSSEHNRLGKTVYLGLKTIGAEAGYYLNRNKVIMADYTYLQGYSYGGYSSDSFGVRSTERRVDAASFGLHFKHFTSNNFYYRSGIDYTWLKSIDTSTPNGTSSGYRLSGQSLAGKFAIGNQWHWGNFALGVDWVGVKIPLLSSTTEEESFGSSGAGNLQQEKEYQLQKVQFTILSLNLGVSF